MIEIVRHTVKSWQSGDMRLRWSAAGMLEAERHFRRIIGYRDLARPDLAVEREVAVATSTAAQEQQEVIAETVTV